jgi:hypothetical protein
MSAWLGAVVDLFKVVVRERRGVQGAPGLLKVSVLGIVCVMIVRPEGIHAVIALVAVVLLSLVAFAVHVAETFEKTDLEDAQGFRNSVASLMPADPAVELLEKAIELAAPQSASHVSASPAAAQEDPTTSSLIGRHRREGGPDPAEGVEPPRAA